MLRGITLNGAPAGLKLYKRLGLWCKTNNMLVPSQRRLGAKFMKYFSNHKVSSSTGAQAETRSDTEPSSHYNPQSGRTAGENHQSSPSTVTTHNAASTSGIQAALVDSSRTNQALMLPQSIIPGTPSGQVSSADQSSREDPALNDTDKILSALQALSRMDLPLDLPQVAKSASQSLTSLDAKRRNDFGVRDVILDISKIILGLVIPLWTDPTAMTEQENVVAKVISYLNTLHGFCDLKRDGVLFGSEWKEKIEGVRRGVQEQLSATDIQDVLDGLTSVTSAHQPIQATPQETSLDQAFHDIEILGSARVNINNFVQSGLDQSRPIPPYQASSKAFKGAKFGGKGETNINNHCHNYGFGQHQPW